MKIITDKELNDSYPDEVLEEERKELKKNDSHKSFPHALLVDGAFLEYDMAEGWLKQNVGEREKEWFDHFYGKISYDHGCWKIFFSNEADMHSFSDTVEGFYGEVNGVRWKTDGWENYIDLPKNND